MSRKRCLGRFRVDLCPKVGAFLAVLWLCTNGMAHAAAPFRANGETRFEQLVVAVQSSPEVLAAAREVRVRDAARHQAHLWPNPSIDATWGTIPIGRTNPPDLKAPLANIPNYRVGLSYTFPIGKRGPIQAVRQAEFESAGLRRCAVGRLLALELARVLGGMAQVELRIAALTRLVDAAKDHERNIEARERQQWASGLEADRASIERGRLEQQLKAAEFELALMQSECTTTVGRPCDRFASDGEARQYLESWAAADPSALQSKVAVERRPDLLALLADERAASNLQTYHRRMALPDPTIRVGFVHDQFVISGNQASSLELTLSLPIPLFDRGQSGVRAAAAAADGYAREWRARARQTEAVLPSLIERWAGQKQRRQQLLEVLIPKAQSVLGSVEHAYQTGLLSVADVIQARRTLLDLMLEEIDGLADAYAASLSVRTHLAEGNNEGCTASSTE